MRHLQELNDFEFDVFLKSDLHFLKKNYVKESCDNTFLDIINNCSNISYIETDFDFEDGFSCGKEGLEVLYGELFRNFTVSGQVFFMYTFSKTKKGNCGVFLDGCDLKDFLIESHIDFYPDFFDVSFGSFFFYFLDKKIFFGMKHPGILFFFNTEDCIACPVQPSR